MNFPKTVILDCYTDEPSGYGVRPYLGTHQIHLSQALSYQGIEHIYLTIEDLRVAFTGIAENGTDTDLGTFNHTDNAAFAREILAGAEKIYIIMGCFVDYKYFSSIPPKSDEVYRYLKDTAAEKVLFYVMGTKDGIAPDFAGSHLKTILKDTEHGNTYRYVCERGTAEPHLEDFILSNYQLLEKISALPVPILDGLRFPVIAEIETGTGCNTPYCSFCIESERSPTVTYREPADIVAQITALYRKGVRHFRLGRQPNFFHYQKQDISKLEELLYGIREHCPDLETLHIDNVNIVNVIGPKGKEMTKLIVKYCTSGNIAPFGIESFDDAVRKANGVVGSADQVMEAIRIINEHGAVKGADGYPKLLPGINLIYNLKEQTPRTHDLNMAYLQKILDGGLQTQRLYYRDLSPATGVSFNNSLNPNTLEYRKNFEEIITSYVLPMQDRVYPKGTVIRHLREVVSEQGSSYLRSIGTCPIRIKVSDEVLKPYQYYDVKITDNSGYRLLEGELVYRGDLASNRSLAELV